MKVASLLFHRLIGLVILGVVLAALIVGQYLTRGSNTGAIDAPSSAGNSAGGNESPVDQSALLTARRLAAAAHGPNEQQLAAQALRFADHAVDQAFETELREATSNAAPLTGAAHDKAQKISELETRIEAGKKQVADLTAAQQKAKDPDDAAQQVALAQAQVDLDNDELNDLRQELVRMGADKHARVQQALDDHEAAQKQPITPPSAGGPESLESMESLPGKVSAWFEIRDREKRLRQAGVESANAAAILVRTHDALEAQNTLSLSNLHTTASSPAATIASLRALSTQRKAMQEYDARIHDQQQLVTIYQSWGDLVRAKSRSVLHGILQILAIIAAIMLAAMLFIVIIRRQFATSIKDRRRLSHYRIVLELVVQLAALGIILVVIFGTPTQTPAILGLVTAGVTIVMKDFIVALIGWFSLMGKNGIRVGDWVEINGVSGEVVEIGMLRTVLLETGGSADAGHPTGRRVTFMNSFAIEGRYFNFSTGGQWQWDELRLKVPRGNDAYDRIEMIRKRIADLTRQDAEIAELEWRQATNDEALRGFSAEPTVDLRPAIDGIEVTVRYITRAQKRYEIRSSLYQEVIRLLHDEGVSQLSESAQA